MDRQEKEQALESLKNDFSQNNVAFLVGVKGLSVTQLQKLRKDLSVKGGRLKITKARLMKIAADDVGGIEYLNPFFKDQIGVVFAVNEPSAIAKVLFDFSKKNEFLKLVAGSVDKQLLDASSIKQVAQLPSREVLLAMLCGTLQAPVAQLARLLNMIALKKSAELGDSPEQQ